jgi:hypothetical protein
VFAGQIMPPLGKKEMGLGREGGKEKMRTTPF